MNTWKERLIETHKELKIKHNDLAIFLLNVENAEAIEVIEWNLLCNQRDIMEAYIGILETRMTNLEIRLND